jgi:hypothetical protein
MLWPAVLQELSLWSPRESVGAKELILRVSIEWLEETLLPQGSRVDLIELLLNSWAGL